MRIIVRMTARQDAEIIDGFDVEILQAALDILTQWTEK